MRMKCMYRRGLVGDETKQDPGRTASAGAKATNDPASQIPTVPVHVAQSFISPRGIKLIQALPVAPSDRHNRVCSTPRNRLDAQPFTAAC
ncbi:hypothetical protein BD309DRAFT_400299 [Dichomitus squalens]|nr:hypothetical protein BD309DRAFT_400299 [Dichomitus squalens]